ncbi:MAG: hypothetical protein ACE5K8_00830 [Candidatus Zixiibacteriota bacterium]
MHKRILMAERSDAIRGVAETVLRQHGFEVISVASAEKALEVLKYSRPDLLIIGSGLTAGNKKPFFESLHSDPVTASIPMLLFDDSGGGELPLPPEVIIPQPFDPKEFLEKVMIFSGALPSDVQQTVLNPLEKASIDDELLDAALALDRIDVTESEVLDKSEAAPRVASGGSGDKLVGYDDNEKPQKDQPETRKVETVMIHDRADTDKSTGAEQKKTESSLSGTGKLEILTDQYGITDPGAFKAHDHDQSHDYEWFVNEMRKEVEASQALSAPPDTSHSDKAVSSDLNISEAAAIVDPVTPVAPHTPASKDANVKEVEKFIDEFKKEIKKARDEEPETIMVEADQSASEKAKTAQTRWEDTFEKDITPEKVNLFTQEFCSALAEKIAEKIVAKIDSEKLLNLLKTEILSYAQKIQKNVGQDR